MSNAHDKNWDPKGHLEIWRYDVTGGPPTCMFDDHNLITSGLGANLSMFFSVTGLSISSYQIGFFQVGVSGAASTSSINQLYKPLQAGNTGWQFYGVDTPLNLSRHNNWVNGSKVLEDFAVISPALIQRVNSNTVRYVLVLDESTGNSNPINEIALFARNPFEHSPLQTSIMCAYRNFDVIAKSSQFSLVFKWTLEF